MVLETPVGRVLWRQGSYTAPTSYTAVWEHRDLKSEAFTHALTAAFHEQPREIRAALDDASSVVDAGEDETFAYEHELRHLESLIQCLAEGAIIEE